MVRYRAADPATLRIVRLDLLTAIYHRASGQTHLVDAPVPELLTLLAAGPLTTDELLARLRSDYDLVDPDMASLAARLEELVEAGLVVRV